MAWSGIAALSDPGVHTDFKDITKLWKQCIPYPPDKMNELDPSTAVAGTSSSILLRVDPVGNWGEQLIEIARSDETELVKNKLVANLCWEILVTLRFGEAEVSSGNGWESLDCPVWVDDDGCPGKCSKSRAAEENRGGVCRTNRRHPYPVVILAKQQLQKIWDGSQYKSLVVLKLHRFACWRARGNPGGQMTVATHSYGHKACVKLGCLYWGSPHTNAGDYRQQVAGGRSRREKYVPRMHVTKW